MQFKAGSKIRTPARSRTTARSASLAANSRTNVGSTLAGNDGPLTFTAAHFPGREFCRITVSP